MNKEFQLVREFLEAFEVVFDKDWKYTKEMLGIYAIFDMHDKMGEGVDTNSFPIIAKDGTFIDPKVDDEVENWGNRARLLKAYRALRSSMEGNA